MTWMHNISQFSLRLFKQSTLSSAPGILDVTRGKPRKWQKGWRFTLYTASGTGILVLCFNLGLLIWVLPRHNLINGRGVLYDGDCDKIHNLSIVLHLVINIFSTLLLSASNYTIQCLSAPTRADIDKVHKELRWLDIGILSVRNFRQIPRSRSILWIILVLSSLPLHLMYNSAIFATTSSNAYYVFLGDKSFGHKAFEGLTLIPSRTQVSSMDYYEHHKDSATATFARLYNRARNGTLEKLDNAACIDTYTKTYRNSYANLLLVTDNPHNYSAYTYVGYQEVYRPVTGYPLHWICPDEYDSQATGCQSYFTNTAPEAIATHWKVLTQSIRYCLVEVTQPHCKLQYSLPLTLVVMVFIVIKAITICYVAITIDAPILTIGDAISSFLEKPDITVRGKCLLSMKDLTEPSSNYNPYWVRRNRWEFIQTPKKWHSAVPTGRWFFGIMSYCISIAFCAFLLGIGLSTMSSKTGIWAAGLQALDFRTLISANFWPTSLISNTLIANLPQLVYSIIYFAYNGILTTMAMSAEWSKYATQRKGLRVSAAPRIAQRSKYFLSLPYRYAIPLMAASSILHWLISQSLFLVGVEAYDQNLQRDPASDISVCGYSPTAIVCSISLGMAMVCCLVGLGFKRFKSGMPVVGSCSLAIAAACFPNPSIHDPEQQAGSTSDAACFPLKWGVVPWNERSTGHCAFSSREVTMPIDGNLYL
ncbi:hypothetical protein MGYG_04233 [Nannizzia gypsea CBS 118893]|uniref:DUF6536 domain-containing protein n=1 Tax=Arthroderma gypseum (strain ATCC MYA-4604 / CBS 118893) TaxID=535722 RepID=E4URX2_ARTGP|nr:hypothetical protein MGYG_04233 [Nannizzia gypsea CBS 118893]EFR01229.1 hypothetical protein MGYG_04233 [Nannizzia gypsea CBS 118893]